MSKTKSQLGGVLALVVAREAVRGRSSARRERSARSARRASSSSPALGVFFIVTAWASAIDTSVHGEAMDNTSWIARRYYTMRLHEVGKHVVLRTSPLSPCFSALARGWAAPWRWARAARCSRPSPRCARRRASPPAGRRAGQLVGTKQRAGDPVTWFGWLVVCSRMECFGVS